MEGRNTTTRQGHLLFALAVLVAALLALPAAGQAAVIKFGKGRKKLAVSATADTKDLSNTRVTTRAPLVLEG